MSEEQNEQAEMPLNEEQVEEEVLASEDLAEEQEDALSQESVLTEEDEGGDFSDDNECMDEADDDSPLVPQSEEEIQQGALEEMSSTIEAILFASGSPVPPAKLSTIAELPTRSVKRAIQALNERYDAAGCSFRVVNIAGGYQLMSLPEYNDVLKKLLNVRKESRLSQAAMETLAIVAYRQPILRADIESIRGVACGEVLRSLMERQLIKIVGRAEVIGRPMLYGTTKKFLEIFGLGSLEDLPRAEELRQPADKPAKKQEKPAAEQDEKTIEEEEENMKDFDEEDDEIREDEEFDTDEELEDDEDLEDDDEDEDFDDDDDDDFDDEDDDEDDEFGFDDEDEEDFDDEDDEDFEDDDEDDDDEDDDDEDDDEERD